MLGLEGIRVISFNHFLMGPLGVQYLGDLGADVIAVEPLEGAFQRKWGGVDSLTVDGHTMLHLLGNRNKRSVALNLKDPRGLDVVQRLVATADVVTENFRPGVMDKLGLGYEAVKAIKPDIIYAAGSGFGPDGPYANRPGQDLIIQAMSGLAAITGKRGEGPRAVGVSVVDHHGAALYAMGILAALMRRARGGGGCRVDVNLLSASLSLQQESLTCYLNGGRPKDVSQPGDVAGWYFSPPYGIYPTADGHVAISLGSLDVIYDLLEVPQEARIAPQRAFAEQERISLLLAEHLRRHSTAHWTARFREKDVWHAPVNDYAAVVADPQVRHLQSFTTVPGDAGTPISLVSHPVFYDGEAPGVRRAPQRLGAQTQEVLEELAFSAGEIRALHEAGIAYVPSNERTPDASDTRQDR
jgi:crotonobetainyl-CoA:carnitine CoA-transferase CaiB-like acyl-CoA transferase